MNDPKPQSTTATRSEAAAPPVAAPLAMRGEIAIEREGNLNVYAYEPSNFDQLMAWAERIFQAGLCPETIQNKSQVMVIIATGRELGLSMMSSMRNLFLVNGRVGMYTEFLVARVLQSPVCETLEVIESTDDHCTVIAKRRTSSRQSRITWTIEDARRAGLRTDKTKPESPWVKYPRRMLMWKAFSEAIKMNFADAAGNVPTVEDLRDMVIDVTDRPQAPLPNASVPIDVTPKPAPAVAPVPRPQVEPSPAAASEPEPPHDPKTGEVLGPDGKPEAAAPPAAPLSTDPVIAGLEKQIREAADGPAIGKARDAIQSAFTDGMIGVADIKPLALALLSRCKTAQDRQRFSGLMLLLRETNKIPAEMLAEIRAEFDRAKNGGQS